MMFEKEILILVMAVFIFAAFNLGELFYLVAMLVGMIIAVKLVYYVKASFEMTKLR
jgi:uncharacterized membrane protein